MIKTEEHDLKMFAAAALQGLIAGMGSRPTLSLDALAMASWNVAKAMIKKAPEPINFAYGEPEKKFYTTD